MKGAPPKPLEPQSIDMINICTKYGFDILIISGSYMYMVDTEGHTRHNRRWTMPGVWHKLPTGEFTRCKYLPEADSAPPTWIVFNVNVNRTVVQYYYGS